MQVLAFALLETWELCMLTNYTAALRREWGGGGGICAQRGEEIIQRLVHKTQLRIPSPEIRKAARLAPGGATGR